MGQFDDPLALMWGMFINGLFVAVPGNIIEGFCSSLVFLVKIFTKRKLVTLLAN